MWKIHPVTTFYVEIGRSFIIQKKDANSCIQRVEKSPIICGFAFFTKKKSERRVAIFVVSRHSCVCVYFEARMTGFFVFGPNLFQKGF